MIRLTNPLNKDGVLYEVGNIIRLDEDQEQKLIRNGLAEYFSKFDEEKDELSEEKEVQRKKSRAKK